MRLFLCLLLTVMYFNSYAETYAKYSVTIEKVQRTSELFPTKPSVADASRFYVSETPAWSGGNCDNWVLLQNNDEKSFSIALAALASGKKVDVIVDDSLPRHSNSCTLVRFTINH